ncbi:MAG: hypothetical protein LBC46_03785 [Treponema sp.]|nr:hypothetical protein [Treponema sp.]
MAPTSLVLTSDTTVSGTWNRVVKTTVSGTHVSDTKSDTIVSDTYADAHV